MVDTGTQTRCPTVVGIEILQDRWVLHIVRTLLEGPKGFNAIGREVGGCSPTTLTHRLSRLETLGIITKSEANGSCRACYRLTEAGAELDQVIGAIRHWADTHLSDAHAPHEEPAPPRHEFNFL